MSRSRRHPFRVLAYIVGAVLLAPAALIVVLRFVNPPTSAFMLRASRAANAHTIDHRWVSIGAVAACMPLAVVAAEDQTFPDHHGFDWSAMSDAIVAHAEGGPLRGASTISQQTAKNLFLWPAKSYVRKAIEAYLTVWLELLWRKRRILEVYLNIAQFGDRTFGVGAAARRLLGTTAAKLSDSQCATLAAVLPDPKRYNAAAPGSHIRHRRAWILRQMDQLGPGYLASVLSR